MKREVATEEVWRGITMMALSPSSCSRPSSTRPPHVVDESTGQSLACTLRTDNVGDD
jgi:hypothetical protein